VIWGRRSKESTFTDDTENDEEKKEE